LTTSIRKDQGAPLISRATHQQVIASGTDVPEQSPSFALPLDEVGISGKTVWVSLPEGRLPFAARITVDLPSHVRGIHMSRLEQAIAELHGRKFTRLCDYARALAEMVVERQRGTIAQVAVTGKRPLLQRSKISRQVSVDSLACRVEARVEKGDDGLRVLLTNGIGVCHITACPCTQVYNLEVFADRGDCPMPTHSQRSQTWLSLRGLSQVPSHNDLLPCLEQALHLTQDLLKRPDEAEIVLKSHRCPQFAEDAVRETARSVGLCFRGRLPPQTEVIIESLSLESIHIHDVCCRLSTTLENICAEL